MSAIFQGSLVLVAANFAWQIDVEIPNNLMFVWVVGTSLRVGPTVGTPLLNETFKVTYHTVNSTQSMHSMCLR